jgi:hypothetical protein
LTLPVCHLSVVRSGAVLDGGRSRFFVAMLLRMTIRNWEFEC